MPLAKLLCIALLFLYLPLAESDTSASTAWQTLSSSDGSFAQARHEAGAVVVNGKLYLLGGRTMRAVQMFDPVSSVWTDLGTTPLELHHFQPVAIGDLIYVVGAFTCCYPNEDSVADIHVFDTTTQTWSINGSMPASRLRGSAAAVVRNNIIYLLGGNTSGHSGGAVAWFDSYNPATGEWKVLPDAPTKRDHFVGVIVSDYLVAAAGRQTDTPNPFKNAVAATDLYDFISEQWSSADDILTLRAGALAAAAGDDIIVAGGEINTSSDALDTVEAMNVYTRQWRSLRSLGAGRHSGGGAVLNNAFHVIAGSLKTGGAPESSIHETLQLDLAASADFDADGLSNSDERGIHGTNPGNADTDSDSLSDKQELTQYATNPLQSDTDGDGIDDSAEINVWNTNPAKADTDADGIEDGDEVLAGTDPLVADSLVTDSNDGGTTQGTSEGTVDSVTEGLTNGTGSVTAGTLTNGATDTNGMTDGVTGAGVTSSGTAVDSVGQSDDITTAGTSNGSSGGSGGSNGSVSLLLLLATFAARVARTPINLVNKMTKLGFN